MCGLLALRELFVLGKFEATDSFRVYQETDQFSIQAGHLFYDII